MQKSQVVDIRYRARKARLEQERAGLNDQMRTLRNNLAERSPDVTDPEEIAETEGRRDIAGLAITSISEQLSAVNAGLQALEDGTYGKCHDCREEIAEARLDALPFATKCIGCAQLDEPAPMTPRRATNTGPFADAPTK